MSVFTTVTRDQLATWLQQYSIGTLVALEGIPAGIENTNYFVTTSRGRFVLTLFEKLKAHELPYYLGLQNHLAGAGVPAPKPIPDNAGRFSSELNGKPAALVVFLPGKDVAAPTAVHCAQAGEMLARIHVGGRSYAPAMENPRGPKWWSAVMPEIVPFLAPREVALLEQEVRFQAQHRPPSLPQGPIHADLFRDNVLFDHGRISGVIDFYFACNEALLYDIAIAVNDWCLGDDGALDRSRTHALLEAYAGLRPFTEAERDAWPLMLRAGALRFWVSRLYDFYLPRPGELTHAKDPAHFGRLLARHVEAGDRLPQLCPRVV